MNRRVAVGVVNDKIKVGSSSNAEWQSRTKSNNSFNASGISAAFIRKTWMLVSLYAAALIRAFGASLKGTNERHDPQI
jgi:hypothetical protein